MGGFVTTVYVCRWYWGDQWCILFAVFVYPIVIVPVSVTMLMRCYLLTALTLQNGKFRASCHQRRGRGGIIRQIEVEVICLLCLGYGCEWLLMRCVVITYTGQLGQGEQGRVSTLRLCGLLSYGCCGK